MHGQGRSRLVGVVLLVLLSLGWGVNWTVMKVALTEIPPWTFRSYSCLLAAVALLGLARLQGLRLRPRPEEWRPLAAAALFNVGIWHAVVAYSLLTIPSGHAALIGYTMPLWLALISVFALGQPLPGRLAAALALGVVGMVVLFGGSWQGLGEATGGSLLMLCGAVSWAAGTLVLKHTRWTGLGTVALTGWQFLLGGVPMLAIALIVEHVGLPRITPLAWAAWLYMVIVGLVFCYWAWFRLVELLSAPAAAISTLLTPVIGVLSGSLLLHEPLSWKEMAATATIVAGLVLAIRSSDVAAEGSTP